MIRNKKISPGGGKTKERLEKIQEELEENWGIRPEKETIWKNVYNKDTNRKISDFIWRIIHNRVKCGSYFSMIPRWEEKQYCYRCGQTKSVEHILIRCNKNHQEDIWRRTSKLMTTLGEEDWTKPEMDLIVASGSVQVNSQNMKEKAIRQRRIKTVVTETMWTICVRATALTLQTQ